MTDQELKDLIASLAISKKESDLDLQKLYVDLTISKKENEVALKKIQDDLAISQKKTEASMRRLNEVMSNVGHNNGDNAEDYFFNSLSEQMVFAGIKYDSISRNIHIKRKRLEDEFDVVMYNGNSIALIECKYKAHEKDLMQLIEKKVPNFKELNPDYADYKIYCGLASFSFYPELEEKAKEKGVAILKQIGNIMEVNSDNLKVY